MEEKSFVRKQLLKNMLYNLIIFVVIFGIFIFTVFNLISNIIYTSIDEELIEARMLIKRNAEIPIRGNLESILPMFKDEIYESKVITRRFDIRINNPRITCIVRNADGDIVNYDELGFLYEIYYKDIAFNSNNIDKIYETNFNGEFHYRAINIELEDDYDDAKYVQLLMNIDSQKELLNSYIYILIITSVSGIGLGIIGSYIVAKRSLKPLYDSIQSRLEFVQNASHELRTPLTIIQAKQELLLQEPNKKIIDKSEDILLTLKETKRLTKLTNDLMILARADNNKTKLQKEDTDIDKFIEEIIKPYQEIAEISEKEFEVDLKFKKQINIDKNKIHQTLIILLDNALKYTEKGEKISVTTKFAESKCVIEVKDTGIGISEEGMKHIFERFYREDKARSRESGGSGLGLAIADSIIKLHAGTIKVSKNEPKGSIFTIKLPSK